MTYSTKVRTSFGVVLAALLTLVWAAPAGAADLQPGVADPATDEMSYQPDAVLAGSEQLRTVASGSTAGFDTDPALVSPGDEESFPPGAGATGWWSVSAPGGSDYTIDSCGSSYPVRMTAYDVEPRMLLVNVAGFTPDACEQPLTGRFYSSLVDSGPDVIRIDDASGAGGDYTVNFNREPIDTVAEIKSVELRKLKRVKGRKRVMKATVDVRIRVKGETPLRARTKLDGKRRKSSVNVMTFKGVRSGRHRLKTRVSAAYGGSATDTRRFRVPFRKR